MTAALPEARCRYPSPPRPGAPLLTAKEAANRAKLRRFAGGAFNSAGRREAKKLRENGDLTRDEVMAVLERQDYVCALSGLRFWRGKAGTYGPAVPTIDRVKHDGPYTRKNIRIVLAGVNSLRGRWTDKEMYAVAEALLANRR